MPFIVVPFFLARSISDNGFVMEVLDSACDFLNYWLDLCSCLPELILIGTAGPDIVSLSPITTKEGREPKASPPNLFFWDSSKFLLLYVPGRDIVIGGLL